VTRQAARKIADGLEQRDYARTERDARDSRVLNVVLTTAGTAYAQAMTEVIQTLNREFCQRVDPRPAHRRRHRAAGGARRAQRTAGRGIRDPPSAVTGARR